MQSMDILQTVQICHICFECRIEYHLLTNMARINPDLVLSVHFMPGGTGTALAKEKKKRLPNMPVMVISGVKELP